MPECQSYQIIINNKLGIQGGFDPFVKTTILAIIYEFFRVNENILLYICDMSDGREASRNRLFLRWFEQEDIDNRFTIRHIEQEIDNHGLYFAMIIQNTNAKLTDIIQEFSTMQFELMRK